MNIEYIKGDACDPQADGNKFIIHVCNDIGGWGRGFVGALSKKWKAPEQAFRSWYKSGEQFELGQIQLVQVEDDLWVANMIGQHDIRVKDGVVPVRYEAIDRCMEQVAVQAQNMQASVHMPRIGCGLAGGTWDNIEPMIQQHLINNNIQTYVYDFG